jgi:CheY-like chemotaxis protein
MSKRILVVEDQPDNREMSTAKFHAIASLF